MILYRISELMLPTLIQRYDKKKSIHFDPVQERDTNRNLTGREMPHFIIVFMPYINLLNLCWIINVYF